MCSPSPRRAALLSWTRWPAALVAVATTATALLAYGAPELGAFWFVFVGLCSAALLVTLFSRTEFLPPRRLLVFVAIGVVLLVASGLLSRPRSDGFSLAALGWLGLLVGLALGASGRKMAGLLVAALALLGLGETTLGLLQVTMEEPPVPTPFWRGSATGTYVSPNHFTGLVNLTFPLAVGWAVAAASLLSRGWLRLVVQGLVIASLGGFAGAAVYLSGSKGGALSFVITAGFVVVLWGARSWLRRPADGIAARRPRRRVVSVLVAGLGAIFLVAAGVLAWSAIRHEASELGGRTMVYRDTLHLIADNPLFGIGPGMFKWRYDEYQSDNFDDGYAYAHNDYLEAFVEWGIPLGLLLWAFLLWRFVRTCRFCLLTEDRWQRGLALGLAGSMMSIQVHSLFDFNLHMPGTLMVFGLVHGIAWALTEAPVGQPFRASRALRVVLALSILFAAAQVARRWVARTVVGDGTDRAAIEHGLRWHPKEPELHYRLGGLLLELPEMTNEDGLDVAREHLELAVRFNPFHAAYRYRLGELYERWGDLEGAEHSYREAARLAPRTSAVFSWRLSLFLLRQGRNHLALETMRTALANDKALEEGAWSLLQLMGADVDQIDLAWPRGSAARRRLLQRVTADLRSPAPSLPDDAIERLGERARARATAER